MLTFLNPWIVGGGLTFLLVGIPVLIHLINLMRHRRVEWAAMEFLLASQKKNRTYVLLKQLLLLLLRMAAVAAVILIVSQPLLRSKNWAKFLGGSVTHHVVVLDDSFSMSDRSSDSSAFDRAKEAVKRIAERAAAEQTAQEFSLIRTSTGAAVLRKEQINSRFDLKLTEVLDPLRPSQTSTGVDQVLAGLDGILNESEENAARSRIVYVLTDFRAREWDDPVDIRKSLTEMNDAGSQIVLVNCVNRASENLAITDLKAVTRSRAVDVPARMEVTVKNFGTKTVQNVPISLRVDGAARSGVSIDKIGPGASASTFFEVRFDTAGEHRIDAHLDPDAVGADNQRSAVVDFPLAVKVLIVDGSPNESDSWFLSSILSPGGKPGTGIQPQVERPQFLATGELEKFKTIYLVNIELLDQASIDALEKFVKDGGGVAMFVGPHTDSAFVNSRLYRKGEGFFPLPLTEATELLVFQQEKTPDLKVTDHPVLGLFQGQDNPVINMVLINNYYGTKKDWKPPEDSTVDVICRMRNNDPLMVEQTFGAGRVVAILTSAGTEWNNWGRTPGYMMMLALQEHLTGVDPSSRLVGVPIEESLDSSYAAQVRMVRPDDGDVVTEAELKGDGTMTARFPVEDVLSGGVYELKLSKVDGGSESRYFAYNVLADEGDLKRLQADQLTNRLDEVEFDYREASDFQGVAAQRAGTNLSEWILYLLVAVLIGEQILSYFLGYHPPAAAGGKQA